MLTALHVDDISSSGVKRMLEISRGGENKDLADAGDAWVTRVQ